MPGSLAARSRTTAVLGCFALACAQGIPFFQKDTDALPEDAVSIVVGETVEGTLDCREGGGPDCVDWYRLRPQTPGRLVLAVQATDGDGEPATVAVDLVDGDGEILGSAEGSGPAGASVSQRVSDPIAFLAAVRTSPETGAVSYVLEPAISTAPERPPTNTTRWTVLEVEPRDGEMSVLIDGGLAQDLGVGYRGRLVENGQVIGQVEIIEVFEEGSRARVQGPLSGSITADTVAEIEVPKTP